MSAHEALTASPAAADTTFTFEGGGWGHAVGMSQWGAKGRADAGQSAAAIIAAYYTGTQLTTVAQPGVRVHLADTPSTTIAVTGATTITGNAGALASVAAGETVEIKAVGAAFQLQIIAPTVKGVVTIAANDTVVVPLNGAPARVSATGNRYNNGRLVVRLPAAGSLQVVNDSLTMQQYLYGLAEVPSSWPIEALKAQALAARTFAYKKVQSPRSANYDLLSTTTDQVYAGYEKQAGASGDRWVAAVDGTDQQMITYGGAPIDALYSSSNGGYSEDSEYAFVSAVPYLRANPDPFDNTPGNPNFRWTRSYSGTELGQYMSAYRSVDIGVVTSYEVSGTLSRVGRIDRANVKLVGTKGTQTLTGAQFRNMINQTAPSNRQLQSTLLFFRPIGSFDSVSVAPGIVNISGWALFQGSATPALAHVYVNDHFAGGVEATAPRPDVSASVPGAGVNVGYTVPVAVDRAVNNICAYAVAPGGATSTLLGCRTVTVDTQPFGSLDFAVATPAACAWAAGPWTRTTPARVMCTCTSTGPSRVRCGRATRAPISLRCSPRSARRTASTTHSPSIRPSTPRVLTPSTSARATTSCSAAARSSTACNRSARSMSPPEPRMASPSPAGPSTLTRRNRSMCTSTSTARAPCSPPTAAVLISRRCSPASAPRTATAPPSAPRPATTRCAPTPSTCAPAPTSRSGAARCSSRPTRSARSTWCAPALTAFASVVGPSIPTPRTRSTCTCTSARSVRPSWPIVTAPTWRACTPAPAPSTASTRWCPAAPDRRCASTRSTRGPGATQTLACRVAT